MDLLFGAFSFDDDPVQDGGHQIGVDTVFKGQLLFQYPPNLFGVQCGFLLPPLLRPDRRNLCLQGLELVVESVVAGLKFRVADGSVQVQLQQAVFFILTATISSSTRAAALE